MTVRSGEFVRQYIADGSVPDDAVQPNGVDLSVGEVYRLSGGGSIRTDEYTKPDRERVCAELDTDDGVEYYHLTKPGSYIIVYGEKIAIPEGHIGEVRPRSRIMRSGGNLVSAYWDAGYEGQGEGLLTISEPLSIAANARIGQMAFRKAEDGGSYDGSHQGERL